MQLSGVVGLTIDSFTLKGGREEAVLVSGSPQTTIRNCTVSGSGGDGVFVDGADQVGVFNNLVLNNRRAGIRAWGATNLQAVNNTVYDNLDNGVSIGNLQEPSAMVTVINNIVSGNVPAGIVVDASDHRRLHRQFQPQLRRLRRRHPGGPERPGRGQPGVHRCARRRLPPRRDQPGGGRR